MPDVTDDSLPVPDCAGVDQVEIVPSWRDRLESLSGRRRDLLLVAAIVAIVIVVAGIGFGRASPSAIAPPSTIRDLPAAEGPAPLGSSGDLVIHVSGAVRAPGLYSFPLGSRVADAVQAAGGARAGADLSRLNLAASLVDGTQIDVPFKGRPAIAGATETSLPLVNINSADALTLETVPGIGPATAAAIIEFRESRGLFPTVDALLAVSGIGPATLESLRAYVTV